jgi:Eukaryotic cytochrome b561.
MVYASNTYKQDQNNISSMDSSTFEHSRLGMTISSIVISQATFGFLSSYFRIFTKNLQALSLINKIHKVVGYSLLITGLVNCYSG